MIRRAVPHHMSLIGESPDTTGAKQHCQDEHKTLPASTRCLRNMSACMMSTVFTTSINNTQKNHLHVLAAWPTRCPVGTLTAALAPDAFCIAGEPCMQRQCVPCSSNLDPARLLVCSVLAQTQNLRRTYQVQSCNASFS
jgi:hypothetical protein